jgi:hypothetical protein
MQLAFMNQPYSLSTLKVLVENIIQIHENVLWDTQYFIKYSRIFSHSDSKWEMSGNILQNNVNPTYHCYESE